MFTYTISSLKRPPDRLPNITISCKNTPISQIIVYRNRWLGNNIIIFVIKDTIKAHFC